MFSCEICEISKSTFFTELPLNVPHYHHPQYYYQCYNHRPLFYTVLLNHSSEAVGQRCSVKKMFLKISENSQENTCAKVSFSVKSQAQACNFIKKEAVTQVFSREFCETFKNTFLKGHLRWLLLILYITFSSPCCYLRSHDIVSVNDFCIKLNYVLICDMEAL